MDRDRALTTLRAHRAPFIFCLTRPAKKPGFFKSEWLKGETGYDDVIDEAQALLADSRDTITSIGVWSLKEGCFVYGFRR